MFNKIFRLVLMTLLMSTIAAGGGVAAPAESSQRQQTGRLQEKIRKDIKQNDPDEQKQGQQLETDYVEGQLIVKFKKLVKTTAKDHAHNRVKSRRLKTLRLANTDLVQIADGQTMEDAIARYQSDPDIEYAEPNYLVYPAAEFPNDPFFSDQWNLYNDGHTGGVVGADVCAAPAWDLTTGSNEVVVAVIDSGVDYRHEDIAANIWNNPYEVAGDANSDGFPGAAGVDDDGDGVVDEDSEGRQPVDPDYTNDLRDDDDENGYADDLHGMDSNRCEHYDYCGICFNPKAPDGDPLDDHGHGTHVSGIIGAVGNNGAGITGVNWNVKIMALKIMNRQGIGNSAGAIDALAYVREMKGKGVNIVVTNNSYGCAGGCSQALREAIDNQRESNVLFVAAAGNDMGNNDITPQYSEPASIYLPNIISVAATNHDDERAAVSNFGRRSVHVGAPGEHIISLRANGTDLHTVYPRYYAEDGPFPPGDPDYQYIMASGTSMATAHVSGLAALIKSTENINNPRDWKAIKNLIMSGGDDVPDMNQGTISGKRINAQNSLSCSGRHVFSSLVLPTIPEQYVVGSPTAISALSINCAVPVGPVTVASAGGDITLLDNGDGADQVSGDGIFTGTWTPVAMPEELTFSVNASGELLTETVTVPFYRDLIVTSVLGPMTEPLTVETGQPVLTSYSIKNQGLGPVSQFDVCFYLSVDPVITTDDIMVHSQFHSDSLSGGEEHAWTTEITMPMGVPGNTYYLGAIADCNNAVNELAEDNNSLAGNQVVFSEVHSDLLLTSLSGPSAAYTDEQVTITNGVYNAGNGMAWQKFTITFYLSGDANITTDDLIIGSRHLNNLAAGYASNEDTIITIPPSVPGGTYFIGAIVDPLNNVINESDRSSNTRTGALITITKRLSDLIVTSVSGPTQALRGDVVTISATIRNQGQGSSEPFDLGVYLSTDQSVTTDDIFLRALNVYEGVVVGTDKTITGEVIIPQVSASGPYYLGAIADHNNTEVELNENNNSLAGSIITIAADLPDAIMTEVTGVLNGDQLWVRSRVKNQGTLDIADQFYVGIYLSTDSTITTSDTLIGFWIPSSIHIHLLSGHERYEEATYPVPIGLASGTYYVGAFADYNSDLVLESDETNNGAAGNGVALSKDLLMTSVAGTTDGMHLNFTGTIKNQGDQMTDSAYVGIYLSDDAVITPDDRLIGLKTYTSIAGGTEESIAAVITLPSGLSGPYYVGAYADHIHYIGETDENNNGRAGNQIYLGPDLLVTSVSGSKNGSQLTISTTVKNQGISSAGTFYVGMYLSGDSAISTADTYVGNRYVGSLSAGAQYTFTETYNMPSGLASGAYYVGAYADYHFTNMVVETDETNNTFAGNQITVTQPLPDLIVKSVSGTIANGYKLTVTTTIKNQGAAATGLFLPGIYLSTDATIDGTDRIVGDMYASLLAGQEATYTRTYTVPASLRGYYFVGVFADYGLMVSESDESNNTRSGNRVRVGY